MTGLTMFILVGRKILSFLLLLYGLKSIPENSAIFSVQIINGY